MSHSLILQLSDTEYAAVEKAAQASGAAPDEWAAARLREQLPPEKGNGAKAAIPPDIYELLRQVAANTGRSVEEVAASFLRQVTSKPRLLVAEAEADAADDRLSQETVSLGEATGADNAAIDADLARAYLDDHVERDDRDARETAG